jgi:hypothetical protein
MRIVGILITIRSAFEEQNNHEQVKYKLAINTTIYSVSIVVDTTAVILFLFPTQRLSGSICALQYHCHGLFELKIYVQ